MSTILQALIVDDEPPARRWLRELLSAHPEISVAAEAGSVPEGILLANRLKPDVIFLDVQMPPQTGFDLLDGLAAPSRIVLVTAHDEFALQAFDANALDYLLKPVHPDRLAESVRRLIGPGVPPTRTPDTLAVDDLTPLWERGRLRMIPVGEIAAIGAEAAYSRVLIPGQSPMLVLRSMSEWERMLPSPPFARLDRSVVVNLSKVDAVHVRSRNECQVELKGIPEKLDLGRTASARLRRLLPR